PDRLIEYILLGSGDSRRHLQESPILGDVWVRYAAEPTLAADLLITVYKGATAIALAAQIYDGMEESAKPEDDPQIAPLQGFVAARLHFKELLTLVVPITKWWSEKQTQEELEKFRAAVDRPDDAANAKVKSTVEDLKNLLDHWDSTTPPTQ